MSAPHHVLIALDESEASMQAVQHVGRSWADEPGVTVRLLHIVGPMPTGLLEHGGASDPDEEAHIEHEQHEQQQQWIRETCEAFLPVFEKARRSLIEAGFPADAVTTQCSESIPEDNLGQLILDDARASGCDTVVVGRHAYPWFVELFHRHVGEVLQRAADGIQVAVVP
ncbi:MAG: universal stress protein [Planctomycetota bacterium]|jgi:nucleotide-binding universal stress UspA family protein